MANVPGVRRRRAAGDPMTDDEQIRTYMRRVQSSLHVRRAQRPRVLEEIENHLQEGAAEHRRGGATRAQAVAHAIEELGPPETVAAAFSDEGPPVPPTHRSRAMAADAGAACAADGHCWLHRVEHHRVPRRLDPRRTDLADWYLRAGVVFALLSYGAYQSIKRADRDRAWRWAAWACAGGALTYLAIGNENQHRRRVRSDRAVTVPGTTAGGGDDRGTPRCGLRQHRRQVATSALPTGARFLSCVENQADGFRPPREGGQRGRSDEGDHHG